jgi:tetratricopeptide (TPR) repeat protein
MDAEHQRGTEAQRPFVGRDGEIERLESHLGHGRLILVTGDPGIGKTRLVEEFAAHARARGVVAWWGRCWEGEGAPAFWPWIEIVRGIALHTDPATLRAQLGPAAADVAQLVDDVRARLPDLPDPPRLDPKQSRFRLFDGITTFLKNAATRAMVLVLEDLHWADTPSLLLLRFLAREIEAAPLLVIGTFRDAEVGRAHPLAAALGELLRHRRCEHLPLGGLGEPDVRRYLDLVIGPEAAQTMAASLHRETDGNPFFLAELVRLIAREPGTGSPGALRPAGVPATVRDVIARRLQAYSPECVDVLRVASVVGRDFTLAVLQRLPELERRPLLNLLSEAISGRLITDSPGVAGGYRFTHSLLRETLYDDLALARRVQLHRSIGNAIEAYRGTAVGAHAAELAHHFLQAVAEGEAERAIHYAARAGEHATAVLAHEEAAAHYTRALHALELWRPADAQRACSLLLALGESRVRAGDPMGAEEAFLRAATRARAIDTPALLGRAALGLGEVERFHDRLGPLLEEALDRLGTADDPLRVRLLTRLAVTLYWSQAEGRKIALSNEAVAMARRLGHTRTLAYALAGRIATLSGPDDVEERLAAASEMRRLAERCDDRELAMIGRGWCIADSLALGQTQRVRHDIDRFAALAAELRHPYFAWWSTAIRTMQAILEGRFAEAETLAEEALRLGQCAIVADATQVFAGHLYFLCLEQERHEHLESIVTAFVRQFPHIPGGHCLLALLYADQGRSAEAEAEMAAIARNDFEALPRNPEWLSAIAALAETSAVLPDAPYAEILYALLTPYRQRVIVAGLGVLCSGSVAHFLGILATRLGRWDEAAAHFEAALRVHTQIEAPPSTAYTQYEYARLALARGAPGDRERAATLRGHALRCAEALGMKRLRRRVLALGTDPVELGQLAAQRAGTLHREGDYWMVRWGRSEFRLRDRVGLQYLAMLVANPAREFLAIDLVTTRRSRHIRATSVADTAGAALGDARARVSVADSGPLLDRQARVAYRRRLEELRGALAEAQREHDLDRVQRTRAEIEALAGELSRAVGFGGRDRRAASPVERARVSATRAIRAAVRQIGQNDAALAHHLAVTIKTGTFCSYTPDPRTRVSWML